MGGGGGGGGPTEFHILYPKNKNFRICLPGKITTSEFVYPKKSLLYLAYPKNSISPFFATPKKSLSFFFATQKNPGVFYRPKKITFGQNFRPKIVTRNLPPPVIKTCEWGPWVSYVLFTKCNPRKATAVFT